MPTSWSWTAFAVGAVAGLAIGALVWLLWNVLLGLLACAAVVAFAAWLRPRPQPRR